MSFHFFLPAESQCRTKAQGKLDLLEFRCPLSKCKGLSNCATLEVTCWLGKDTVISTLHTWSLAFTCSSQQRVLITKWNSCLKTCTAKCSIAIAAYEKAVPELSSLHKDESVRKQVAPHSTHILLICLVNLTPGWPQGRLASLHPMQNVDVKWLVMYAACVQVSSRTKKAAPKSTSSVLLDQIKEQERQIARKQTQRLAKLNVAKELVTELETILADLPSEAVFPFPPFPCYSLLYSFHVVIQTVFTFCGDTAWDSVLI